MANRLANETSPYLLQHADNPVDWFPWGPEAFAEAKARNVPVLLSVGYSACHWCHVMEAESFSDPVVAGQMNSDFVNVKVDREERPDVDELYMRAVQAFSRGHGGWPMTVFLTPDGEPFFGGTYFPPATRAHDGGGGSVPGFVDIMRHVAQTWGKEPERIEEITQQIRMLLDSPAPATSRMLARDWLGPVAVAAAQHFDPVHGGFEGKPKFPPHGTLAVLLVHHARSQTADTAGMGDPMGSLALATRTLDGMSKGGMFDHVGGGFCRYSVDEHWCVPHFEKMLVDNAQLVPVYLDAWRLTGRESYARVVRDTLGFLLRELREGEGAFASSLDADSEGGEGTYYAFVPGDLDEALGEEASRAAMLLSITEPGNFEHGASVVRTETLPEDLEPADRDLCVRALEALGVVAAARPRPALDTKRIVAWNGLAISAFARAGAAMGRQDWVAAAVAAFDDLRSNAFVDGRWRRTCGGSVLAFADDYANLLVGVLDLYEATFDPRWLSEATDLAENLRALFWVARENTLYMAGGDAAPLLMRSRVAMGGAEPSAVGMAALGLVRAARLLQRGDFAETADGILRSVQAYLVRSPRMLGAEALAGAWLSDGGSEVAIVGAPDGADTLALLAEVRSRVLPFTVIARVSPDGPQLPWTVGKSLLGGRAIGYLCEAGACQLPTPDPGTFGVQLDERIRRTASPTVKPAGRVRAPAWPTDPAAWLGVQGDVPSLESLKGQVVVLDFWTYCCINCLHVLPELAALEARYKGEPVVVLGVHSAKFPAEQVHANIASAMARHGVHHPVLNDAGQELWQEYTVRSWPTLVVIDAEGRIAMQQSGEVRSEELIKVVDALLAEGRHNGSLAAQGRPAAVVPAPAPRPLAFPGKVHVYPDAFEQEMGLSLTVPYHMYVADTGNHRILECALALGADGWPTARLLRTFGTGSPGLDDGPASTATFRRPLGVRRMDNTLYVADTDNHALRTVDLTTGQVVTVAGTGRRGTTAPLRDLLVTPRKLDLRSPWDVDVLPHKGTHVVFLAMAGQHQLWVYANGNLGIHTGSGREDHIDGGAATAALAQPSALAVLGRYLLFVDAETSSVRAVDLPSHQVVTVVGRGLFDFGDVDGPSDQVRLQHPLGITFIGDTLYVADTLNHKIKAIGLQSGQTRTVCGGDRTELSEPGGIARFGRFLIVADTNNHRLRVVDSDSGVLRDLPLQA